jgi:hypothetical protein
LWDRPKEGPTQTTPNKKITSILSMLTE